MALANIIYYLQDSAGGVCLLVGWLVVSEAHSTTISFDASIHLLMGLVNGYGGKHLPNLQDSEVASPEFLIYARVCPWEFSHVLQVNWDPSGIMSMAHCIKLFDSFHKGIKVHQERCLLQ